LPYLNRRARDVLEVRSRDELAHTFWRLALAQPQWMLVVKDFLRPHKKCPHRP